MKYLNEVIRLKSTFFMMVVLSSLCVFEITYHYQKYTSYEGLKSIAVVLSILTLYFVLYTKIKSKN